jgi:hypothetical protein
MRRFADEGAKPLCRLHAIFEHETLRNIAQPRNRVFILDSEGFDRVLSTAATAALEIER